MPNQNNTCRLCLSSSADFNVLENEETLNNIVKHCKVKVEKNDGLPELICISCMLRVEDVSKFIEQCCLNDKTLRLRCKDNTRIETDKGVSNSIVKDDEDGNFDVPDDTSAFNNDETFSHSLDKAESLNLDNDMLMKSVQVADNGTEYVNYLGVRIIITRPKTLRKAKVRKELGENEKHVSGRYLCPICGLYMSKQHELTHSQIKKFACDICNAGCKTKNILKYHILRHHSAAKHFECDDCGKVYKFKDELYKHIKYKHNNTPRPCVCQLCQMSFFTPRTLMNHMRSHTGEKKFECDYCGMKFVEKNGMKSHMKIHTKEKPYCCKICKKSFSLIGTLRDHIRLHTGERPYECPLCKKRIRAVRKHEKSFQTQSQRLQV